MEVFGFVVAVAFQVFFLFLTLVLRDRQFIGVLGVLFGLFVVGALASGGLTEVIGYVGGSEVTHSYGVDVPLLVSGFLSVITSVAVISRLRR